VNWPLTEETLREAVDELGGDPYRLILFVAKDLWFSAVRLTRAISSESDPPPVFIGDVRADGGFPPGAWTLGVVPL
jgi:hypothetical protein